MTASDRLGERIRRRIEEMLPRGERWVCGVSGGADSTALLRILAALAPEWGLSLVVGHVDHGLRGDESTADAAFVVDLAGELGLPVVVVRNDQLPPAPAGLSPEASARARRRRALLDIASADNATRIALAHTRDDQAETVLFRAVTGTSLTGLSAMDSDLSGRWVRPLLDESRRVIRRWLRDRGHPWREDATNRTTGPRRNRVRREVLPLIEGRLNPKAVDALARLAGDAGDADRFLLRHTEAVFRACAGPADPHAPVIDLDTERLRGEDPIVRRYVLRHAIERVRGTRDDVTREHLTGVDAALERGACGAFHLPGGVRALVEQGRVRIQLVSSGVEPPTETTLDRAALAAGAVVRRQRGDLTFDIRALTPDDVVPVDTTETWFDLARLALPVSVRNWQDGDRMTPFGMSGSTKVSDLFTNMKIPRSDRPTVPIVADDRGILWVVGIRRSDRARVGPNTREVLRVVAS